MAAAHKAQRGRHAKDAMPTYGSRTDVGLVRDHNEDSLAVEPPLFAVCDGMGGHAAGEVASEIAVQTLMEHAPRTADGDALARAAVEANRAIIRAANEGRGRQGMGTTMTAAVLDGRNLVIAQVGDSRAYLLHQGSLQRLTRDHSLVADMVDAGEITEAEARVHPRRSVITRALGSDPNTLPDIYEMHLETGDRLLLCSDGLSSMIEDSLIESTLVRMHDPQAAASALVNEAINAGGFDNVTVVVVDVKGDAEAKARRSRRRGRLGAIIAIIALIAVLAAAAFGSYAYLNHVAFITQQDDGEVIVCRGIPGSFAGVDTWSFDHAAGVNVSDLDLPANTLARLTEDGGMRVDSVADADALIDTWKQQAKDSANDDAAEGNATSSNSTAKAGDVQ